MDRSEWDDEPVRPPLPPEDRIWRHPSELAAGHEGPFADPRTGSGRSRMALALGAGALGALLLAAGVTLLLTGSGSSPSAGAPLGLVTTVAARAGTSAAGTTATASASSTSPGTSAASTDASGGAPEGVVRLVATTAAGPRAFYGVVVEEGVVVTTAAGIREASAINVELPNAGHTPASVTGVDQEAGTAVLSTQARSTGTAPTGRAGSLVAGTSLRMPWTAAHAKVVKLGQHSTSDGATVRHLVAIELPKGVQPAEGEPLLDASGAVVALCTHDGEGHVAGVPIEIARGAARSVVRSGKIIVPWLGVGGRDLGDGDDTSGALVQAVDDSSPAHDADLQPKDVITAVADVPVRSMAALVLALREHDAGEAVTIDVTRGDQHLTLRVMLGGKPAG